MRAYGALVVVCLLAIPVASLATDFDDNIVKRHNVLRAQHGAPPLKWSPAIAKVAQNWANTNARDDKMHHRDPNTYGENIYWVSGGNPTGAGVVNSWYGEIAQYNYSKPGFTMNTGHFTQVVWKGSHEIGCGSAKSKRGGTYVVCNYSPPGNYEGQYPGNVQKPR